MNPFKIFNLNIDYLKANDILKQINNPFYNVSTILCLEIKFQCDTNENELLSNVKNANKPSKHNP